ncbi:hypothetical protein C8R42DRAFT_9056 [Lentinula raphanica]|nr:hypothetical protein C8R42DRAFT_9056 [Lentinula raphanica]
MPIILEIRSLQNRSSFLTAGRSNITLNISESHSYCSIRTNKKRTALCTMRLLLTRATTLYLSLLLPTYILATPISLPAGQPASVQDISHTPTIHARQPDPPKYFHYTVEATLWTSYENPADDDISKEVAGKFRNALEILLPWLLRLRLLADLPFPNRYLFETVKESEMRVMSCRVTKLTSMDGAPSGDTRARDFHRIDVEMFQVREDGVDKKNRSSVAFRIYLRKTVFDEKPTPLSPEDATRLYGLALARYRSIRENQVGVQELTVVENSFVEFKDNFYGLRMEEIGWQRIKLSTNDSPWRQNEIPIQKTTIRRGRVFFFVLESDGTVAKSWAKVAAKTTGFLKSSTAT